MFGSVEAGPLLFATPHYKTAKIKVLKTMPIWITYQTFAHV